MLAVTDPIDAVLAVLPMLTSATGSFKRENNAPGQCTWNLCQKGLAFLFDICFDVLDLMKNACVKGCVGSTLAVEKTLVLSC